MVLVSPNGGMSVIIIPFDYEQLPVLRQRAIIPICIASMDRHGKPIARVWFEEGVAPVQNQLRSIARYKLGDVRCVSELAEITVHKLWERHGDHAGIYPWRRVWARAIWEARDLAAGGSQWRIKHTIPLALGSLEGESMETAWPTRPPTKKSMNESYWWTWSNAGLRRTSAARSAKFSRCCGRGTRGTKSPRRSMTPSRRL